MRVVCQKSSLSAVRFPAITSYCFAAKSSTYKPPVRAICRNCSASDNSSNVLSVPTQFFALFLFFFAAALNQQNIVR